MRKYFNRPCKSSFPYLIQKSGHLLVASLMMLVLLGCSKRYHDLPVYSPFIYSKHPNQSVGRFKTSFVADQIDFYYRGTTTGPIGIATLVNLDDLYTTSSFGRVYGEQLLTELSMRGYDVVELRHSDALHFLATSGEFALSRDVAAIKPARDLAGVLVGTYVVSPVRVYVNVRMIDPSTSMILSGASAEMARTSEISRLLRGGSAPSSLERIPVKHLGRSAYPLALFERNFRYPGFHQELDTSPPDWPSAHGAGQVEPKFGQGEHAAEKKHDEGH